MNDYPFADRAVEDERLLSQGYVFDPSTRRLLREAGIAPGMRVLDLGSGAGNVARLVAEAVGPSGSVLGVDADPEAVSLARRHTPASNVEFQVADVQTLDGVPDGFDAVTGRLVLLYLSDAVAALRQAAARVRPGGIICMHECDLAYYWAGPETPLWAQTRARFVEAFEKAGFEPRMSLKLHSAYIEAGLPAPSLHLDAYTEGGPDAAAWAWANVTAAAIPLMERFGVATREDMDPKTLADRLLAELLEANGHMIAPLMTGAWAARPE
jgi:SAM-dependent methyltransferase